MAEPQQPPMAEVEHAVSWWQFAACWFGIRTRAWCGAKVLARRAGRTVTCRECLRALAGETHG